MLIRIENGSLTGYPVDYYNFRKLFPSVSFPRYLTPADVEPFDFRLYEYSQIPEDLERYEKTVEGIPTEAENGIYYQKWLIVDMSDEERADKDAKKCQDMRDERSGRLMQTDWTQIADANVDASEWQGYRQSLRDVPSQSGFPWEISWPEPPSV